MESLFAWFAFGFLWLMIGWAALCLFRIFMYDMRLAQRVNAGRHSQKQTRKVTFIIVAHKLAGLRATIVSAASASNNQDELIIVVGPAPRRYKRVKQLVEGMRNQFPSPLNANIYVMRQRKNYAFTQSVYAAAASRANGDFAVVLPADARISGQSVRVLRNYFSGGVLRPVVLHEVPDACPSVASLAWRLLSLHKAQMRKLQARPVDLDRLGKVGFALPLERKVVRKAPLRADYLSSATVHRPARPALSAIHELTKQAYAAENKPSPPANVLHNTRVLCEPSIILYALFVAYMYAQPQLLLLLSGMLAAWLGYIIVFADSLTYIQRAGLLASIPAALMLYTLASILKAALLVARPLRQFIFVRFFIHRTSS